jgi:hypothetical protein
VNLSAFATRFPERRPFFSEGSQLLGLRQFQAFYSRRIGAAPAGRASGDFVQRPSTSRILSAAKLTGRLPSGTSIGILTALTDQEHAEVSNLASPRHEGPRRALRGLRGGQGAAGDRIVRLEPRAPGGAGSIARWTPPTRSRR